MLLCFLSCMTVIFTFTREYVIKDILKYCQKTWVLRKTVVACELKVNSEQQYLAQAVNVERKKCQSGKNGMGKRNKICWRGKVESNFSLTAVLKNWMLF